MTPDEFKAAIAEAPFRRELHHLLWEKPFVNKEGQRDFGWTCREHALFIGALAMLHGFQAAVVHGRAEFCVGPTANSVATGISQDPHWWTRIVDIGSCDLSVRLDSLPGGVSWDGWDESFLLGGKFTPADSTSFTSVSDPIKHEQICAIATHATGKRAANYLQRSIEPLGLQQIENARKWCNSPLTDRLKKLYPTRTDIYAKAILHLDEILNGVGKSVTALSQMAAWGAIAKRPGNGRVELAGRFTNL